MQKWHRRSVRLQGFDYAQTGSYFITICTYHRERTFGFLRSGAMHLTPEGHIARDEWFRSLTIRPELRLDAFIVMPDHVHGIASIRDDGVRAGSVGAHGRAPLRYHPDDERPSRDPAPLRYHPDDERPSRDPAPRRYHPDDQRPHRAPIPFAAPRTIGTFVRGYKTAVTIAINRMHHTAGIRVWQRNYHEHIIRDAQAFDRIARYIARNPHKAWHFG